MKGVAALIIVLALVIGTVGLLTDCHSQGRFLTLDNGRQIDMKCHWSSMAEIALAVSLLAVGGLMTFGRGKETQRSLGIMGAVVGAFVVAVPTVLIGVCANEDMLCKSIMQPTLILTGTVAAVASLAIFATSLRGAERIA
jgi:hypothetical protein